MTDQQAKTGTSGGDHWSTISRRGWFKALVSIPVLGVFFYNFFRKQAADAVKRQAVMSELGVAESGPAIIPNAISKPPSRKVRVGIIGYGGEGESLVRHAGFASPDWLEEARKNVAENPGDKQLETYLTQDDLNIAITGVCEVFDVRAERGVAASAIGERSGGGPANPPAKRFRTYTDMLESGEVDGVIIATPDHWHAQMSIDAAAAGIHV